ncbi:zinc finger CCCH domain-containing protein 23 [Dorcoceras hygrometricum]|uniref:Zinc finger CCCH domain-containing protein 23 n=1 Tax=Dorcoceras hygrometricum TaxID=472368 RepID=A0A2Z7BSD1_9LAMI|nr:zinc finger CCCH domain-containing protein 23 [Dorcoceras hygrometricum]
MMMMIGDRLRLNPTVQIPHWDHHFAEDPTPHLHSPNVDVSHYENALAALHRYLPSNKEAIVAEEEEEDGDPDDFDFPVDAFSCDNFRMFEFKVKKCTRARPHDWTECPFAHPGEKARRRDPRKYHYSGSACPDFRKGACRRGDACEYAHGVFECWLHPARYRTEPCKDGTHCRRRVCFFAHTPDQLRVLPHSSPDASPGQPEYGGPFGYSPTSALYSYSPPQSPRTLSPPLSPNVAALSQLSESVRCLQISKPTLGVGSPSWGLQLGSGFGSPRSPNAVRVGFTSLPSTPIQPRIPSAFDIWDTCCEEEPAMERVESGRQLRERIYAKLSKENSLDRVDQPLPSRNP